MQVLRADIWNESVAIFKNPNFNLTASPRVKFEGESGIVAGGLSREYGSLLQKVFFFKWSQSLWGNWRQKAPSVFHRRNTLELFEVVGKMVAYLIVHLDIGIPCLSPPVYHYISTGSLEWAANFCFIEDITEGGTKWGSSSTRYKTFEYSVQRSACPIAWGFWRALIGYSNSEYPLLFISEQRARENCNRWRE